MGQFDKFMPEIGLPTTGNRAVGESVVVKKPKPKTKPKVAASSPPPKPPKDSDNKTEHAPTPKRRPPEGGLGALVRK